MIISTDNHDHVMRGPSARFEHSLAMIARLLVDEIAGLRSSGGIPADVRTVVSAHTTQQLLVVEIFGLSLKTDPDWSIAHAVMTAIFQLASVHNVVRLGEDAETLFTQRILVLDTDGRPYAGLVGAAMGTVESRRLE